MAKLAPVSAPIHELLQHRRTTHAFEPERPVARADRDAILEAARWAPSWRNSEPWRLLVCDRYEQPAAWQSVFASLTPRERPWVYNVALLIVTVADVGEIEPQLKARALFDTGAAALQLTLEATARGLATHITSGFDDGRLRTVLGIPELAACVALVCVGHPADAGTLGREVYRREVSPRTRSAWGSRCFEGYWGRPLAEPSSASEVVAHEA